MWVNFDEIPATLAGVMGNVQTLEHAGTANVMVNFQESHFKRMGTLTAMLGVKKQGDLYCTVNLKPAVLLKCKKSKVVQNPHQVQCVTNATGVINTQYMERVGVLALWGSPTFPNIAGALSTPTKRKPRRPRGEGPGTTEGGTVGSGDEGDQAATELEESAGDGPAEVGPEPEAAPTSPTLQSLAPASERGAVSREDAGQLCTLAGPLVAVGGGGCGPGTADGPINVDSDVDTDDDNGNSGSEPDGAFAVGSARGSPGRRQTGIAKFVGRERKLWSSRTAAGPVTRGTGAGSKAGMVGRVHRSYTGPRRAKVVVGGAQTLRPRAAARRQTGRPRLAQQVGSPEPKRTKLGKGGHVQTPAAQNPVEGAFVAAAERLKTKARGRTVPVASPPPLCVRVQTGAGGCGSNPPFSWSSCKRSPRISIG